MRFYKVGGCVRDEIIGRRSKDIDFAVEVESFDAMRKGLIERGYEIFVESPQFLTIRARHPDNKQTIDFVMCRKDGIYKDGRHPDTVTPGSIFDDLARRDFTMNAIAKDTDGNTIDPHGGCDDIERRVIRCVGNPTDRFREDGLRVVRAIRFAVVLGFRIEPATANAMHTVRFNVLNVSVERVREEIEKAFMHDTVKTLNMLQRFEMTNIVFSRGLRASATMKG